MKVHPDTVSISVLTVLLGGLSIFSYGFFPVSHSSSEKASLFELPKNVADIQLDHSTYKPTFQRSILMIIDALRLDFVEQMPYLRNLVAQNESCLIKLKVHPPTVTMPRIKALTSGTVPNFIDLVLNFGGTEMKIDNILSQIRKRHSKIVFYGDNTWTTLFPNTFARKGENVDSLFVNDFYGGDKNITERLTAELIDPDWALLILHYLGLDHIGHVEGPFSAKVGGKLLEMDKVVTKIVTAMAKWNSKPEMPTIFLLTGDHGMRDTGGHGGSSVSELFVPLVVAGPKCRSTDTVYNQIDVTTTLSILLGTPIPHSAIGCLIPELIEGLAPAEQLFAYNYNGERLLQKVRSQFTLDGFEELEFFRQHQEALECHRLFLFSYGRDVAQFKRAKLLYGSSSQQMSDMLSRSFLKYDLGCIGLGITMVVLSTIILCITVIAPDRGQSQAIIINMEPRSMLIAFIVSMLLKHVTCKLIALDSDLVRFNIPMNLLLLVVVLIFMYFYQLVKYFVPKLSTSGSPLPVGVIPKYYVLVIFISLLSLTATSFIEEEHQLWYYLCNTLFVLLFLKNISRLLWHDNEFILCQVMANKRDRLKVKEGGPFYNQVEKCFGLLLEFGSLMITHCILRRLNQTGDKWSHLRDIGDFLAADSNIIYLSFLTAFALVLSLYTLAGYCGMLTNILTFTAFLLIYFYRTSTGQVLLVATNIFTSSKWLVILFWLNVAEIVAIEFIPPLYRLLKGHLHRYDLKQIFGSLITLFSIVSCLLHKPHNIILNALLILTCRWTASSINQIKWSSEAVRTNLIIVSHFWIGKLFYYYQGNSNSLATIDLNAGYVGLDTYNPILVGLLLTVNTFHGPILSLLVALYHLYGNCLSVETDFEANRSAMEGRSMRMIAVLFALPICVYLVVATLFRHHLFVWTVFSPKLIYELYTFGIVYGGLVTFYVFTGATSTSRRSGK